MRNAILEIGRVCFVLGALSGCGGENDDLSIQGVAKPITSAKEPRPVSEREDDFLLGRWEGSGFSCTGKPDREIWQFFARGSALDGQGHQANYEYNRRSEVIVLRAPSSTIGSITTRVNWLGRNRFQMHFEFYNRMCHLRFRRL